MAEADFTFCFNCKYFLGNDLGSCRRFPTYQNRHANEWCGEWAMKIIPLMDAPQVEVKRGRPRVAK